MSERFFSEMLHYFVFFVNYYQNFSYIRFTCKQVRYQREIERLEKENRDLRKEIILKRQKSDGKKRRMKVLVFFNLLH